MQALIHGRFAPTYFNCYFARWATLCQAEDDPGTFNLPLFGCPRTLDLF
jgi:hypothetical protein